MLVSCGQHMHAIRYIGLGLDSDRIHMPPCHRGFSTANTQTGRPKTGTLTYVRAPTINDMRTSGNYDYPSKHYWMSYIYGSYFLAGGTLSIRSRQPLGQGVATGGITPSLAPDTRFYFDCALGCSLDTDCRFNGINLFADGCSRHPSDITIWHNFLIGSEPANSRTARAPPNPLLAVSSTLHYLRTRALAF